ncbi:U4/U6.U5 tri-snRNP-associated protein 1 [Ceratocystis fimbriata CBS 114723]|uniref:U4/U6.U5 tri-snRNP-associated protein 1 n=1 Tax=Ceratocystis fimbriata CBS 114723 TaxID=1035309 RepID=A0A2C5WTV1_9PEZI|nr:U4/U6.U5 tri-snRNP-associated protein 1 [Ceratocystis fimbriata CBS 114723]
MDASMIEEQNKLRASMGMKPLPVAGSVSSTANADTNDSDNDDRNDRDADDDDGEVASTIETCQAASYDNYRQVQAAEAEKRKRAERMATIKKQREKEQRNALLKGSILGDAAEADVDAKSWLMGQKKRQKKIDKARKMEEELAEAEARAAAAIQYTFKDLAGLKVAHEVDKFGDGDEQILTLKDASIDQLEEEGDELENVDIRDQEKLKERLDLKIKRPDYNPLDDDNSGLLSKYDEEIYGKKLTKFTLDTNGAVAALGNMLEGEAAKAKSKGIDVDMIDGTGQPSSDYLDISEVKVKKPKKGKKSKSTRRKQADDENDLFPAADAVTEEMEIDLVPSKKRKSGNVDLGDDDDLQAALSKQRREALKKRKKMKPEDLAKQLKTEATEEDPTPEESAGLVIGEVSEFVSGLGALQHEETRKAKAPKPKPKSAIAASSQDKDGDQQMGEAEPLETYGEYPQEMPGGDSNNDGDDNDDDEDGKLMEEKTVAHSMGSALSLLRERGILKETNSGETHEAFRKKQEFLAKKRQMEVEMEETARLQRERDRNSGRLDRMSACEREEYARQQNAQRETQQSRKMAELFSENFVPTFEIKYVDDDGRRLDTKGAFKQLSHAFHGKGSGKGKTELKLKKIEEEKRREAQSMLDASQNVGMSSVTAQQLKKRKEAGVRLA